jgi:hypothetical protein
MMTVLHFPPFQSNVDSAEMTAMVELDEHPPGCPDADVRVAVIAVCGSRICSSLSASSVAGRIGTGREIQEYVGSAVPSSYSETKTLQLLCQIRGLRARSYSFHLAPTND